MCCILNSYGVNVYYTFMSAESDLPLFFFSRVKSLSDGAARGMMLEMIDAPSWKFVSFTVVNIIPYNTSECSYGSLLFAGLENEKSHIVIRIGNLDLGLINLCFRSLAL